VSTATCYRAQIDKPLPDDIRGKVYSYKVGEGVSYDRDLGAGWKHVAATRTKDKLKLYVNGQLVATQDQTADLDISSQVPLRIGFGPQSYFEGRLRDVRLYNRAITDSEAQALAKQLPTAAHTAGAN